MTHVPGRKLVDLLRARLKAIADKKGITVEELIAILQRKDGSDGGEESDEQYLVNLQPYLRQSVQIWNDIQTHSTNTFIFLYNVTAYCVNGTAWLFEVIGRNIPGETTDTRSDLEDEVTTTSITTTTSGGASSGGGSDLVSYMEPVSASNVVVDPVELLKTLFEVHGHQILVDGVFNGDPHPGEQHYKYAHILLLSRN